MTVAQITGQLRWQARNNRGVRALLEIFHTWRQRSYERQMLTTMNDQMLRDIGITRCDAMNEAAKPFWRA